MNLVQSEKEEVYTVELNKIAVSSYYDKIYILENIRKIQKCRITNLKMLYLKKICPLLLW